MEPQSNKNVILAPSPKTVRGQPSSLDSNLNFILYFNGISLILRSHDDQKVLTIAHPANITAAKFSPNFRYVASIDEKGNLLVHEIHEYKLSLAFQYSHMYLGAKTLDWTCDEKKICIAGNGQKRYGKVISLDTGTQVGDLQAITAPINSVSFRTQRPFKLAMGGDEYAIKFYEGPPFKYVKTVKGHKNFINQVKYNGTGKYFVSISSDRKIIIYDGLTSQILKEIENAHEGGIYGISWVNEETFVTVASDKKTIYWNTELQKIREVTICSKEQMKNLQYFLVGVTVNQDIVNCLCLNGEIKQIREDKIINSLDGWKNKVIKILKIGEDCIIMLDSFGKIFHYNLDKNRLSRISRQKDYELILDGSYDRKSQLLYILSCGKSVIIVNAHEDKIVKQNQIQNAKFIHGYNQSFICFGNDALYKYDIEGKLMIKQTFQGQPTCVEVFDNIIFVGCFRGSVHLFDLYNLKEIASFKNIPNPTKITSICLCDEKLFIGDSSGSIKAWTVKENGYKIEQLNASIGGHDSMVTQMIRRQKILYTFGMDNTYSVWKIQSISRTESIKEVHKGGIICAKFIQDKLITSGGDLLVKIHKLV